MRVPRFRAPKYLLFYLWTTRNGGHFGDGFRRPPLPEWERDEEGGNCAPVGAEIRCDTGGSSRPAGPGGPRRTFELAAGAQKQYCRDWVRLCRAATGRSSKERGRAAIGRRETRQGETGSAPRANAKQLANAVIRGLAKGHAVEIDGLGTFHPDARSGSNRVPEAAADAGFVRRAGRGGLQRVDGRAPAVAGAELAAGDREK